MYVLLVFINRYTILDYRDEMLYTMLTRSIYNSQGTATSMGSLAAKPRNVTFTWKFAQCLPTCKQSGGEKKPWIYYSSY